ncbi:unnamed protein product, partial [Scytosiphon promiscuus]
EFRELVSCSNCTDYQVQVGKPAVGTQSGHAQAFLSGPFGRWLMILDSSLFSLFCLLNSTLCATTRTMSCILENFQTPTGVTVPEVLVPYMGGLTFLEYVKELPKGKREAK